MHVHKVRDVIERTGWTFINTFLGLLTVSSFTSIDLSTVHKLESAALAALFTVIKATAAQHVGDSGMGDALPGGSVVDNTP